MSNEFEEKQGRTWYVLHVKPRTEKKVNDYLSALRVFHYLPLLKKVSKVQRRRVVRHLPAFPGYVFTRLDSDERRAVLATRLVVRTLVIPRPRETIHQLRQIEHARRLPVDLCLAESFTAGERVRVVSGPLRGLEGAVKRLGRETKLVLEVSILGRALEAAVGAEEVERV